MKVEATSLHPEIVASLSSSSHLQGLTHQLHVQYFPHKFKAQLEQKQVWVWEGSALAPASTHSSQF